MTKKILALLLAVLTALSVAACSKRDVPSEDNPPSPEEPSSSAAAPPELSIPEPETPLEEAPGESQPEEELSQEAPEPPESDASEPDESSAAAPANLSLTKTGAVTVDIVDATGSAQGTPQNLSLPLPAAWVMDGTIVMYNEGKIGEVVPCRKITDPGNPFAGLNLPEGYGVFEAGGSQAVTWAEEVNTWDASAGKGATITVRYYYKAKGDLLYGMYFQLAYDGTKTISEATAAEVFGGLGPA